MGQLLASILPDNTKASVSTTERNAPTSDRASLLIHVADLGLQDKSATTPHTMRVPPVPFVLLLGALSTPMVIAWLLGVHSVWFTLGSLVFVWVVCPVLVFVRWPHARKLVLDEFARTCHAPTRQLIAALLVGSCAAASALLVWHFGAESLGLPPPSTRARLSMYGLSASEPGADIFLIAWLTLVNPFMEEFFWRLFLTQLLLQHWGNWTICGRLTPLFPNPTLHYLTQPGSTLPHPTIRFSTQPRPGSPYTTPPYTASPYTTSPNPTLSNLNLTKRNPAQHRSTPPQPYPYPT